jgi:hypothetical protein
MKVAMWVAKSSTAAVEGQTEVMFSSWHFIMTLVMYLARCSVIVTTLPWPMGAFGPRKAVNCVSIVLDDREIIKFLDVAILTEIVRHARYHA